VLLKVNREIETEKLGRVVEEMMKHHDALRMRYEKGEGGRWRQINEGYEEGRRVYEEVDLREVEGRRRREEIEKIGEEVQRSLRIEEGELVRVVYMRTGGGGERGEEGSSGRLLIVIHHLVVDGVSWRVLLEDLQRGYEQERGGGEVRLGRKSTSMKRWGEVMKEVAEGEEVEEQRRYWEGEEKKEVRRVPRDKEGGRNSGRSGRVVRVRLSGEETEKLLRKVAQAKRTQINEVLMMGLVEAIGGWVGERRIRVDMEGHGREEEVVGGEDVTRTVGWMTS